MPLFLVMSPDDTDPFEAALLLLKSSVKREVCSGNIKNNFMFPENASCSHKMDIISSFVF